jgi:hypothetical protein
MIADECQLIILLNLLGMELGTSVNMISDEMPFY